MKARSQSSSTPKKPSEPRETWTRARCLEELRKLGTKRNVDGMARYGIVAKVLAGLIDDPAKVTSAQMERWVRDFDNWDTCDGTCCHLFVFAKPAWDCAIAWTKRTPEFEKRAGFALLAYLA